jgi:type II secretory pathway pseudopilin PulG
MMKMKSSGSDNCAGFCLLEALAALSCALVLTAIAVPNAGRMRHGIALWGGTRLIESSLQWGRMHAITTNTSVMFQVDPDGRGFYWSDPVSGAPYASSARIFAGGVRLTGFPKKSLRFYPRGNAAPAGTFTLTGDAGTYRVIVNLAGRIRIEQEKPVPP